MPLGMFLTMGEGYVCLLCQRVHISLAGIRSTRISLQWDMAPVSALAIHSFAPAYTDPRFLVCSELSLAGV